MSSVKRNIILEKKTCLSRKISLITFAYNAKRFETAILFFLFSTPSVVFRRTAKSFLINALRLVTTKACDQDLTQYLDAPKDISINIVSEVVICEVCGIWYSLFTVTNIQSIQKSTRNSQKLGNKLASWGPVYFIWSKFWPPALIFSKSTYIG